MPIPSFKTKCYQISGPYLGFFVCGDKLGFREISDQYSYKKQPSKIRHYVRKKHLVFLAGATAPFAPPLCTALQTNRKNVDRDTATAVANYSGLGYLYKKKQEILKNTAIQEKLQLYTTSY